MLGGDCSPCCGGGWYCCPDPQCALDNVNSISVTLATNAGWYVRKFRSRAPCSTGYEQFTSAVPIHVLNGTHSLSKTSATRWAVTLPVDPIGCLQPTIEINLSSAFSGYGYWQLSFTYPAYYWYRATLSGSVQFKTELQMQCNSDADFSGPYCSRFAAEFEQYKFSAVTAGLTPVQFQCNPHPSTNLYSGYVNPIVPSLVISSDGPPPPSEYDVDVTVGDLNFTATTVLA